VAAALHEALLDDTNRAAFVADTVGVVDAEVAGKKGAAGFAVKGGYAAVRKVNPAIVRHAVKALIPQFIEQLEPYWADYLAGQGDSFAAHLTARSDEVADGLLTVSDARLARSSRQAVKKVYAGMRPSAKRHVVDALPRLGDLVERYAR
jgi:hypothetical protein